MARHHVCVVGERAGVSGVRRDISSVVVFEHQVLSVRS